MVFCCQGGCPSAHIEPLVTEIILITSAEQLLDCLNLPFNEIMASWVVRTACSQSESPLGGKLFVFLAGKLYATVTDDVF